jgi:hypothetical protein
MPGVRHHCNPSHRWKPTLMPDTCFVTPGNGPTSSLPLRGTFKRPIELQCCFNTFIRLVLPTLGVPKTITRCTCPSSAAIAGPGLLRCAGRSASRHDSTAVSTCAPHPGSFVHVYSTFCLQDSSSATVFCTDAPLLLQRASNTCFIKSRDSEILSECALASLQG